MGGRCWRLSGEIGDVLPTPDISEPGKMADAVDIEMESVSAKLKALEKEEKLLEKSNKLHAMKLALKGKEQKVKKLRGTKPISDIAVFTSLKVTLEKPPMTKAKAKTGKITLSPVKAELKSSEIMDGQHFPIHAVMLDRPVTGQGFFLKFDVGWEESSVLLTSLCPQLRS